MTRVSQVPQTPSVQEWFASIPASSSAFRIVLPASTLMVRALRASLTSKRPSAAGLSFAYRFAFPLQYFFALMRDGRADMAPGLGADFCNQPYYAPGLTAISICAHARSFADVIAHLCQSLSRCVGYVRLLLAGCGFSAHKH